MDRKKKILLVLFGLLIVSVVYRYRHPFEQQRVTELRYTPGQRRSTLKKHEKARMSRRVNNKYPTLSNLNLFLHPPRHSATVIRNLFFSTEDVKKKTAALAASSPSAMPQQVMKAEDPVQQAMKELSRFRVFGYFENNGEIVLFIERGRDIFVVRKGDWIDGRFQVREITPSSITIWARDIGKTVNVALDQ